MVRLRGLAVADELVTLQGRGNLKPAWVGVLAVVHTFRTQDLPDTAQIDVLNSVVIQSNYVLDGPAQIRLSFRQEQDSTGADVLRDACECHTLGTRAHD
jgi:hypothetical protein